MKIFILIILFVTICEGQQNSSHLLHGLFESGNASSPFIHYGIFNVEAKQFTLISSLNIDDVGNPLHRRFFTPLAYDPNTDVIYMSAPNKQNQTLLSVINATTGSRLRTYNPMENSIISLQYDIFQKQLFAHIETGREMETQVVEIDTNNGKIKEVLGTISQALPTQASSFCPICKKYFLIVREQDHYAYVAVNSTDGGGVSWRTPLDIRPISMHFDYKTFTMYTVYVNESDTARFQLGILNRTIGSIGKVIKTFGTSGKIAISSVSTYDVAENFFYSLLISFSSPISLDLSYVNVNTADGNDIELPRDARLPLAWFIKQFVH